MEAVGAAGVDAFACTEAGWVAGEFCATGPASSVLAQAINPAVRPSIAIILYRKNCIAYLSVGVLYHKNMPTDAPEETDILCENCGYMLNGLPPSGNCPECGTAIDFSVSERLRQPPLWEIIGD